MDDIVFRTVLLRGAQGAQGEPGTADAIPTGGVISLDGSSVPEGFEETTIDTVPTKNSNNVVESGGIYDSEKDIYAVMGEMGAKNLIPYPYSASTIGSGVEYTDNGDGSIKVNGTGGSNTNRYVLVSLSDNFTLKKGVEYILTDGCIDTGLNTFRIAIVLYNDNTYTNVSYYTSNGITKFTIPNDVIFNKVSIYIAVNKNVQVNNVTIKPMLRLASDTDDTYQQYAKTNKQLTDEIANKVDKVEGKGLSTNDYDDTEKAEVAKVAGKAEKTATASGEVLALAPTSEGKALIHTAYGMSVQDGTPTPSVPVDIESAKVNLRSVGKNLIPYPYYDGSSKTSANVEFTVNADGSISCENTSNGAAMFFMVFREPHKLKAGRYKISGCPSGGSTDTYYQWMGFWNGSTNTNSVYETGSGATINVLETSENLQLVIGCYAKSGSNMDGKVFKPMLTFEGVLDQNYELYKKTDITTNLTLRAIEVSSTDNYNLVRDNKYYIADTLDYSEDNGFVVTRRIGHDVIDGSTLPVVYSGVDRQTNVFYISETRVMPKKDTNPVISDRFQKISGLPPLGANGYIRNTGSNNLRIYIYTSDYTTADAFNAFFAQNNTNVDFILAEPTTENITTEQALALLSLKTYDESTSISSQAEPSCTVAIEYAKERLGALTLIAHNLAKGNDLRIAELEETP